MKRSDVEMGPGPHGVEGNEVRDEWAGEAVESLEDTVPKAYLRETSFAHMTRTATEARSAGVSG